MIKYKIKIVQTIFKTRITHLDIIRLTFPFEVSIKSFKESSTIYKKMYALLFPCVSLIVKVEVTTNIVDSMTYILIL